MSTLTVRAREYLETNAVQLTTTRELARALGALETMRNMQLVARALRELGWKQLEQMRMNGRRERPYVPAHLFRAPPSRAGRRVDPDTGLEMPEPRGRPGEFDPG